MNDSTSITDGQRRMLVALDEATRMRGFAPTQRELMKALGLRSTNGVAEQLAHLQAKGLITRHPHACRTLAITDAGRTLLDTAIERRTA